MVRANARRLSESARDAYALHISVDATQADTPTIDHSEQAVPPVTDERRKITGITYSLAGNAMSRSIQLTSRPRPPLSTRTRRSHCSGYW